MANKTRWYTNITIITIIAFISLIKQNTLVLVITNITFILLLKQGDTLYCHRKLCIYIANKTWWYTSLIVITKIAIISPIKHYRTLFQSLRHIWYMVLLQTFRSNESVGDVVNITLATFTSQNFFHGNQFRLGQPITQIYFSNTLWAENEPMATTHNHH